MHTHYKSVDVDPGVLGELIESGQEEHEASVPVGYDDHHEDQVQDTDGRTRQVEDLQTNKKFIIC